MSQVTELYLKTFVLSGLMFSVSMGIVELISEGQFHLVQFFCLFFIYGVLSSSIFVSKHIRLIREFDNEYLMGNKDIKILSYLNVDTLFKELEKDPSVGRMQIEKRGEEIKLRSKIAWRSYNEIRILLISVSNEQFEYSVTSEPNIRNTIDDYKVIHNNLNRIKEILEINNSD